MPMLGLENALTHCHVIEIHCTLAHEEHFNLNKNTFWYAKHGR
jgi:hypothetical protein